MKVDKKLEYTLIVLNHILSSNEDKLHTAKELSRTYSLAFDSVSRVMQRMASNGFLISEQGPSGGYKVIKDIEKRTLLELINAISKKTVEIAKCIGGDCDKKEVCNIITPIESLNNRLREFYQDISIGELLSLKGV